MNKEILKLLLWTFVILGMLSVIPLMEGDYIKATIQFSTAAISASAIGLVESLESRAKQENQNE